MTKIAILGASGHIGKNVVFYLSRTSEYELFLCVRSVDKMTKLIKEMNLSINNIKIIDIKDFGSKEVDVVINATGVGNSAAITLDPSNVLKVTEDYDNKIINYLTSNKKALYINFSSGVVYGTDFLEPANDKTVSNININDVTKEDSYTIAKFTSEVKHRQLKNLNIVDIRVFSFYSRFADLSYQYLISDIINCIKNKKTLITNKIDIIRDFIHPEDLVSIITKIIQKREMNIAIDAYSKAPISKFNLISFFKDKYDLKFNISDDVITSITGVKMKYYSENKIANKELQYMPVYDSLGAIEQEVKYILS